MGTEKTERTKWLALLTALGGSLGLSGWSYAYYVEPRRVEVTHLHLKLPRLAPAFDGYRLVQISDIHMDGNMSRERLAAIVDQVQALEPDLIVNTGDFVARSASHYAGDLIPPLRKLYAPDGVLAVLGNHDHWSGADEVRQVLQTSGITELRNTAQAIERQGKCLYIGGVDSLLARADRLPQVLAFLQRPGAAILLAHEPDYADRSAASGRFDLQLSGHSHGGQIRLPLIGPPYLPRYARKYPRGLYQIKGMQLYTNRGLGTVHLPFRFRSRPEITLFILHPADPPVQDT